MKYKKNCKKIKKDGSKNFLDYSEISQELETPENLSQRLMKSVETSF